VTNLANNPQGGGESASADAELADTPGEETEIETGEDTDEGAPEPETEEVDYEGKKYKLPKELKDAVLRQADYTKKTQEVAQTREQFKEREAAFERSKTEHAAFVKEASSVHALNDRVAEWEKTLKSPEWAAFERNPETAHQAQSLFRQYLMDKDSLGKAAGDLQQKISQRTLDGQRDHAKHVEEGHAAVARDVKDWNPETFGKVKDFGVREFGLKAEEIASITDPRFLKVLHRAFVGDQASKKLAATNKAAAAQAASPLPIVGSNASANARRTTDASGDRLSTAEWMKREVERTRKKK
jgi:hypothetical protein